MIDIGNRRLLVVGMNYAPEHAGIAPYTTQACEDFASHGAIVQVLSGIPHYPHWTVPDAYRRRLIVEENRNGVALRRLRHYVPGRQTALRRAVYEMSYGMNVIGQKVHAPDVVLTIVPSLLGSLAAMRLAKRSATPLVVWLQDMMGRAVTQSGIPGGTGFAQMAVLAEQRLLRSADGVIVISESFREHLLSLGIPAHRIHVLRNWAHVSSPTATKSSVMRRRLGWAEDEIVILHTGNMGLKQGLENVVEAARLASSKGQRIRFVLMGEGSQRGFLGRLGANVQTLQFVEPVTNSDFPGALAAADMLLVNERASARDMSLPSKLTSYFQAGMPVIAAVPTDGSTAREVLRSGAGLVVAPEDPQALIEAVEALGADKDRQARLGNAAIAYASTVLSREAGLRRLRNVLAEVITTGAPNPGR